MTEHKTRRWPWITAAAILVVAGLYAAAGFWGLPYLIKSKLPGAVREQTGLAASLGRVSFNPFSLRLEAEDFVLGPAQPKPLASVKRLVVDVAAASLWRWALICQEVIVEEPFIKVILRADGSLNLAQLSPAPAAPPAGPDQKPFPFLLKKLNINQGSLWFLREQPDRPGNLRVIPIDLELTDLSTLPELCGLPAECGPFNLTAASPQGERLVWRGRLSLSPLASSGRVQLRGWKLATLYEVAPDIASLAPPQGILDLNAAYQMALSGGGLSLELDPVELGLRQVRLAQPGEGASLRLDGLSVGGKLRLDRPGEKYRLRLDGLQASLRQLSLGREGQPPLITLNGLQAAGGSLDLDQRTFRLESLELAGGRALAALDQEGKLNWSGLLPAPKEPGQAAAPAKAAQAEAGPGWRFILKKASLEDYGLSFSDQSGAQPAGLELNQLKLGLGGLAWPLAEPWPFSLEGSLASGGKIAAQGKLLSLAPDLEAEYALEAVDLKPLQPYLDRLARLSLGQGQFSSQGRLAWGRPAQGQGLSLEARASLKSLSLREPEGGEELLGLDTLTAPSLRFSLEPASLSVERADLSGPRLKLVIGPKGEINLVQVFKGQGQTGAKAAPAPQAPKAEAKPEPARPKPGPRQVARSDTSFQGAVEGKPAQTAAPTGRPAAPARPKAAAKPGPKAKPKDAEPPAFAFQLGVLHINEGKLDFSDLSLEPKFSSIVRDLRGSARDVGNRASSTMPLRLRGRVDRYGQAEIAGRLLPLAPGSRSRLKMNFENLDLHHLSPYAAKFAGWRIKEGKLYLEMDYRLQDQRLVGSNQVLIRDLVLGDKLDQPGAPNLPLDLAVALLKDSRGRIEIAVPVSGDLSDPQVSVAGLIGVALGNLVSKVITAPFSWLGGLVGVRGEELSRVDFEPGSHRVSPPQEEKLAKLAQAMKERPQLKLKISGGYNSGLDGPALKRRALVAELTKMSGQEVAGRTQKRVSLSSAAAGRSIEALYLQRYSRAELDQLKREVAAAPGRDGKPRDEKRLALAQRRAMFRALLKKEPLDPARLTELAGRRASAAARLLSGKYGLASGRLSVGAPQEQPPGGDKSVPSPLSLASEE